MKNLPIRALAVLVAVVGLVGAGYQVRKLDGQRHAIADSLVTFETQVRGASQTLAAIGAAQRAYVAEGQNSERWQAQLTTMVKSVGPMLTELRQAAKTPEAQGALESAIETMTTFGHTDARVRDYLTSGQRLSASDVIFADGSDQIAKAEAAIEDARARERTRQDATDAATVEQQLFYLGGAVGLTLIMMLALFPIPRVAEAAHAADDEAQAPRGGGLGLSQHSSATSATGSGGGAKSTGTAASGSGDALPPSKLKNLATAAEICRAMARVRDSQELPSLVERATAALDATGVIVWMAEGKPLSLRPVLAHGYAISALSRMGTIEPDADNATAVAYRTLAVQTLPADEVSGGAIVAPLITADGCSGAMAVELNKGVEPSEYLTSVATILAAQLATLITPAPEAAAKEGQR